jgi:hypothetical protein
MRGIQAVPSATHEASIYLSRSITVSRAQAAAAGDLWAINATIHGNVHFCVPTAQYGIKVSRQFIGYQMHNFQEGQAE